MSAIDSIRQIVDSSFSYASRLQSMLSGIQASGFTVEHALMLTSLVTILLLVFIASRIGRKAALRAKESPQRNNIEPNYRQIRVLNDKIQKLEDLNRSYLHLVTNISHVVKKINAKPCLMLQ